MGNDEEFSNDSDLELDNKEHAKLIDNILSLNKKVQLKKPSRTEPTLEISEYNLVKSVTGNHGSVKVSDLTNALKRGTKYGKLGAKALAIKDKSKTLPKPLEKPQADRIRRTVAYESVKKKLDEWEPVVTSNRGMTHLSFPLNRNKFDKEFSGYRLKSDLQIELERLEPKVEETEIINLEEQPKHPLTVEEILELRREGAKMRAIQSYKEAKARRQNKIKSKKFHRIERKQKIKNQLKEFEQLQKSNPEEALKKLEQIERVRAEERASLRHRSTGKWAKNQQIRAKYDKDSRQALAQQLTVSRELTQKLKATNEDSDSENDTELPKNDLSNPWINSNESQTEIEEFVSGYRKYWEEANNKLDAPEGVDETKTDGKTNGNDQLHEEVLVEENEREESKEIPLETRQEGNIKRFKKQNKAKTLKSKQADRVALKESREKNVQKSKKLKRKRRSDCLSTSAWEIESLEDKEDSIREENVEDVYKLLDSYDNKLQKRLKDKYKKLKSDLETTVPHSKKKLPKRGKTQKKKINLDLNPNHAVMKPSIDEQLDEISKENSEANETSEHLNALSKILKTPRKNVTKNNLPENINPNDIIKTKPSNLDTEVPDVFTLDENEEDTDQRGVILEAFEDDDIVDEFHKDKRAEIDKDKPEDINLNLPGWGNWGGLGIKPSKRKTKRFIIRFPKENKRRDKNRGDLIINEKADLSAIRQHLVTEVPFPFKNVKDFEASIRSPVGNTFIPETAYTRIIKPAVTTKLGAVIEPMTEEVLLKKKK